MTWEIALFMPLLVLILGVMLLWLCGEVGRADKE